MNSKNRFKNYEGREVELRFLDGYTKTEQGILGLDGEFYVLINGWRIAVENVRGCTPTNSRTETKGAVGD